MNIDRRTLRVTHPAYVELRSAIHKHIRKVFKNARDDLYQVASKERKYQRANYERQHISAIVKKLPTTTATAIERELVTTPIKKEDEIRFNKAILKKYTVSELFEVVSNVAKEVLTPAQLDKFLRRLAERLKR